MLAIFTFAQQQILGNAQQYQLGKIMIEPLTTREFENQLAIKQARAAVHYAITQNECYRDFWNREPQIIVDSLNENLPLTLERFSGNTALGEAVNTQLAHTSYAERCVVVMPEGYAFNGTAFSYVEPLPAENEA